jgi:hypothetical protein
MAPKIRSIAYPWLGKDDYYFLTNFETSSTMPIAYDDIKKEETLRGKLRVDRFEVSQDLFLKLLNYIKKEGLITRDPAPEAFMDGVIPCSFTVYTLKFELHVVEGKRGGWFIVSGGGREPTINEEFISYGPMSKSGSRSCRRRRKLSQSEKAHVEYLDGRTPNIEKLYEWVSKKYLSKVKKVSLGYANDVHDDDGIPF